MIVILCKHCLSATSLNSQHRKACECGRAFGYFETQGDITVPVVSRFAVPIGLGNGSLQRGVKKRPYDEPLGYPVDAFVMPHKPFKLHEADSLPQAEESEDE